jgi:hypothetical protein
VRVGLRRCRFDGLVCLVFKACFRDVDALVVLVNRVANRPNVAEEIVLEDAKPPVDFIDEIIELLLLAYRTDQCPKPTVVERFECLVTRQAKINKVVGRVRTTEPPRNNVVSLEDIWVSSTADEAVFPIDLVMIAISAHRITSWTPKVRRQLRHSQRERSSSRRQASGRIQPHSGQSGSYALVDELTRAHLLGSRQDQRRLTTRAVGTVRRSGRHGRSSSTARRSADRQ